MMKICSVSIAQSLNFNSPTHGKKPGSCVPLPSFFPFAAFSDCDLSLLAFMKLQPERKGGDLADPMSSGNYLEGLTRQ